MRMTHSLVQVAVALMEAPDDRHWGYELSQSSGVRSGVMYPLLTRMLNEGWLADGWEDAEETGGSRPPRRYYTLTDKGRTGLGGVLRRAETEARFAPFFGGPAWVT
ncbi:MAG: PadR family transcriptional regulator [Bifidobacteriaceae bacterium]|nr:PadR family transcriptional regulator [Bifidobacteriaceae bacterium]